MKYSQGFRNGVLQQVLPPFNRSVASVARERGISPPDLLPLFRAIMIRVFPDLFLCTPC
jgi:acyl-homoserine lactone acylase PvdQ